MGFYGEGLSDYPCFDTEAEGEEFRDSLAKDLSGIKSTDEVARWLAYHHAPIWITADPNRVYLKGDLQFVYMLGENGPSVHRSLLKAVDDFIQEVEDPYVKNADNLDLITAAEAFEEAARRCRNAINAPERVRPAPSTSCGGPIAALPRIP